MLFEIFFPNLTINFGTKRYGDEQTYFSKTVTDFTFR